MKHRGMWVRRAACALALVGSVALAEAPQAGAASLRTMTVAAVNFRFASVPRTLAAGDRSVNFFNLSRDRFHEFVSLNLGPRCGGFSRDQLIAEIDKLGAINGDPIEAFVADCPGGSFDGAAFAPPGGRDTETFSYAPGRHVYFCGITEADGTPHYKLGMLGVLDARGLRVG